MIEMIRRILSEFLDSEGSTRPLGLFRIALVLLLWSRYASDLALWKSIHDPATVLLGIAFFVLSGIALVGIETRRAMALLAGVVALIYYYLGQALGHVPFTHHHAYLLLACTVLCALGPCDRSFSVDRWLALKRGESAQEKGPLTANYLIALQLAAVYFWTAIDKSNISFLSGIRLEQIFWFHYQNTPLESLISIGPLVAALATSIVIAEYFLAFAILLRRWTWLVLGTGILLHGSFYWMLPVSTFSLTMLAMYLFVFKPESVHQAVDRVVATQRTLSTDAP